MFSSEKIKSLTGLNDVLVLAETDSTNTFLKKKAEKKEGSVVIAKKQTAGRGRLGRTFVSEKNGLYMSVFLTPEFGPLQRVAFIFTDAELEYDEMYNGKPLCRKCGACVRECPGGCIPAINSGKTISVNLGGKICEWGDIDVWKCFAFYTHAGRYYNPFVPKEVWDANEGGALDLMEGVTDVANEEEITKVYDALAKYFPSCFGYNMAKCGGCIRACISMLEKKGGCMEGRFKEPLRTKKAWRLDR